MASNKDCKIWAVILALKHLMCSPLEKERLLCRFARNDTGMYLEVSISADIWCRNCCRLVYGTMILQWIPSFTDIWGNYKTDKLSKEVSNKPEPQTLLEFAQQKYYFKTSWKYRQTDDTWPTLLARWDHCYSCLVQEFPTTMNLV